MQVGFVFGPHSLNRGWDAFRPQATIKRLKVFDVVRRARAQDQAPGFKSPPVRYYSENRADEKMRVAPPPALAYTFLAEVHNVTIFR
jgi:hypothetical protein